MPDPLKVSRQQARRIFRSYPTDTACHFASGADLEPRYLTVRDWIPDGATVLDIGCNSGAMGERLIREKNCVMYGIEPNPQLASLAFDRGYVETWCCLVEDMDWNDGPPVVDVVIAMDPLDYALDVDECMRAMLRPLKHGGIMVGDSVHKAGIWGDWRRHSNLMRSWSPIGIRSYLQRWLLSVEVVEVAPRAGGGPQTISWRGVKP